ncbi:DUF4349 domain-containing protein [bacterium]|nr:DUF4349 domain-containing protein [bacterium]
MSNKALAWLIGGAALFALVLSVSLSSMNVRVMPMMGWAGSPSATSSASFGSKESFGMMAPPTAGVMERAMDSYADGSVTSDFSIIAPEPAPSAGVTAAEVDQKIIKTGFLDLEVENVGEAEAKIAALAAGNGGYVQDSNVSERADGTHYGTVTVRVASDTFDTSMDAIKAYATVVLTESAQGQDVTEQYTDLEAQLRNAQAQETEYLKILAKATTVEDILNVQSYLSNVRYQIESLQGRIQYLSNATSYSTISVNLSEETSVRIPTKGFDLVDTLIEAAQALVAIVQNLAVVLVWLAVIGGGTLIPLALIVWAIVNIVRAIRRRR